MHILSIPPLASKPAPRSVLLAEDARHDIDSAQRAWSSLGYPYDLHTVQTAEDCIDYLFGNRPDHPPRPGLLLLDVRMPMAGGLAVLEALSTSALSQQVCVAMVTTSPLERDIEQFRLLGAHLYVEKPMQYQHLQNELQDVVTLWETHFLGIPPTHAPV